MDFRVCSACTPDQKPIAAQYGAEYRSDGCPKQDSYLLWRRNRTTHTRLCCRCARSPSRHGKRMTQWLKRRTRPVRKPATARLSQSLDVRQMTAICAKRPFGRWVSNGRGKLGAGLRSPPRCRSPARGIRPASRAYAKRFGPSVPADGSYSRIVCGCANFRGDNAGGATRSLRVLRAAR